MTFPHPSPPATVVQYSGDPGGSLGFPDCTSPGPASFPIGRSGPHTANQNGGGLYRYENETGKEGHMGLTISDFFTYSMFYSRKLHFMKEHMKIKI
jgi:hypothetical protein